MTPRLSKILIGIFLVSCKTSPVTSDGTKPYRCTIKRYRRANANTVPIVFGHVISGDPRDKATPVSGSLFLDGQKIAFYDADRADTYEHSITPGTHRLQVVTITYYTAEASFSIKSGDSLRVDFQLQQDKRHLH